MPVSYEVPCGSVVAVESFGSVVVLVVVVDSVVEEVVVAVVVEVEEESKSSTCSFETDGNVNLQDARKTSNIENKHKGANFVFIPTIASFLFQISIGIILYLVLTLHTISISI